jgi:hypothetical protein
MFANCTRPVNEALADSEQPCCIKETKICSFFPSTTLTSMLELSAGLEKKKKFGVAPDEILVNIFFEFTSAEEAKIEKA